MYKIDKIMLAKIDLKFISKQRNGDQVLGWSESARNVLGAWRMLEDEEATSSLEGCEHQCFLLFFP